MKPDKKKKEPKKTTPPPDMREDGNWFERIGPEDESDDVIADNLNEYGFNQMDEDDFESDPVGPSDMPDWTENATYGEDRPLMPDDKEPSEEEDLKLVEEGDLD